MTARVNVLLLITELNIGGASFKRLPRSAANFRLSTDSKTVGQTAEHASEHLEVIEQFLSNPDLSKKLGLSPSDLKSQATKGQAIVNLYAFWGQLKRGKCQEALTFLWHALSTQPRVLLHPKWPKLVVARARRALREFRK